MRWIFSMLIACVIGISGCANLNPQIRQELDNQNGRIDEIRNNQNGISLELGKLKQNSEIIDSELDEVQQGMLNLNAAVSRNENSGIQILQGDGALILIFGLGVVAMLLWHYRRRAVCSEQAAEIMAQQITGYNDPVLNDRVLQAAMYTPSEKEVYKMMKKQSAKQLNIKHHSPDR